MEINISILIESDFNPHDFYGSVMSHGENAASDTWYAALEYAKGLPHLLDTDEKVTAFRQHVEAMGFGSDDVDCWGLMDFAALFLQLVAAEMVDYDFDPQNPDWNVFESSGSYIFGGHLSTDGEAYFSLG